MNNARIQLNDAERTPCEVWTRVMGYHRPVSAFNNGKKAEHAERCYFSEQPKGTQQRPEQLAA
ncbi:anaerobic ribonucleoside-triphosphate reductase [Thiobaca trueperi]|uniref:Anaerobic ribonucleoside-triphosphate reductase-like protein n=1 Tax=Thiobaca trueperi TaxID=127458 RepID=A0A4R3N162_9GAMM|nr:anaerobic ribonucleoside-triphosphate reductase [Thiobaca trueperi]TCT20803.1 anaerobic ribonucleoside-triphosphate reductase-like protein [Thiobaca trueperi]